MRPEIIKGSIIWFCIFFTGVLSSHFFNLDRWSLKREIDPLQVISIIISIFVVIYISMRFDKLKERSKVKKDIIIRKSDDLIYLIRQLLNEMRISRIEINKASSMFKIIYTEFDSLSYFVDRAGLSTTRHKELFLANYRNVRSLTTKTPTKGSPDEKELFIKDGHINFSASRSNRINAELKKLENLIIDEQVRLIDL